MSVHQPDPLDQRRAQELHEERGTPDTPLALFVAGVIPDWQAFVDADEAYRAANGLPPVPELTAEQERRLWWKVAASIEARRSAGSTPDDSSARAWAQEGE